MLLHDFGGCAVGDVVAAVGLTLADLFPPRTLSLEGRPPERRPWPAEDVLRAVAFEALIAAAAIENVARGEPLSTEDRDRALLAAERLHDAAVLARISHWWYGKRPYLVA